MRLRSGQLLVDAQRVAQLCAPGLHQLQGLLLCYAGQLQLDSSRQSESFLMLVAFSEGPQRKCVYGAGDMPGGGSGQ